jgi:hypothetical protein
MRLRGGTLSHVGERRSRAACTMHVACEQPCRFAPTRVHVEPSRRVEEVGCTSNATDRAGAVCYGSGLPHLHLLHDAHLGRAAEQHERWEMGWAAYVGGAGSDVLQVGGTDTLGGPWVWRQLMDWAAVGIADAGGGRWRSDAQHFPTA